MSRPTLVVKDRTLNDARMCLLKKPKATISGRKDLWTVDLEFIELPRYRWT
jgi:hypothetical protein